MYRYGLLLPTTAEGAEEHNTKLLGPNTLGIEVTEPALAARCGLGNIDPQHGPEAAPDAPAAIEAALNWPLPPKGARLVTIRTDLDSLGAMAVLQLRSEGVSLTEELRQRVTEVARTDRFDKGPWPGEQPLPETVEEVQARLWDGDIPAMAALAGDTAKTMEERVAAIKQWLAHAEIPEEYADAQRQRAERLFNALQEGRVKLSTAAEGRIAVVESEVPGALLFGYLKAPVVVALHPAFPFRTSDGDARPGRKFTVCQWVPGHVDLASVYADLNRLEPGWGGSSVIGGSPQGRGSALPLETIVEVVARNLVLQGHRSTYAP